jgi:hypothetical protein
MRLLTKSLSRSFGAAGVELDVAFSGVADQIDDLTARRGAASLASRSVTGLHFASRRACVASAALLPRKDPRAELPTSRLPSLLNLLAILSPLSAMSEDPEPAVYATPMRKPPYRRAIQITEEMRQHCHIYLDEQLCTLPTYV